MTDQTAKRPLQFAKPIEKEHPAHQGVTVQFFLKHGAVVLYPVPPGEAFNFAVLVQSIRSSGCFMSPDCYIPGDSIGMIGLMAGAPQTFKVQQPAHPTRQ